MHLRVCTQTHTLTHTYTTETHGVHFVLPNINSHGDCPGVLIYLVTPHWRKCVSPFLSKYELQRTSLFGMDIVTTASSQ